MPDETPRRGRFGFAVFSAVLLGSGALLTMTLARDCSAGKDTVQSYIAAVRGGEAVSPGVGGSEAAVLTAVLSKSESVSVDNFQSQAGTSCYWLDVRAAGKSTSVQVVLSESESGMRVIAASIRRDCSCPDPDFEQRCHLVD